MRYSVAPDFLESVVDRQRTADRQFAPKRRNTLNLTPQPISASSSQLRAKRYARISLENRTL
jgi:hypothetical protein